MSESEDPLQRIAAALEALLSGEAAERDWLSAPAYVWDGNARPVAAIRHGLASVQFGSTEVRFWQAARRARNPDRTTIQPCVAATSLPMKPRAKNDNFATHSD